MSGNRYGSNFPRSILPQVQRSTKSGEFAIAIATLEGTRRAIAAAAVGSEVSAPVKKFAERIAAYASGKGGTRTLSSTNERLAKGMREAVLESYIERVIREKRHPSYRLGDRYSGGALARALRAPGMFVGSYNGIAMGETRILSSEAKHWARLNYGASPGTGAIGASPGYAPASVALTLFGQPIAVLTDATGMRPGFTIPRGIWIGETAAVGMTEGDGRTPGFYPTSSKPFKVTRGIAARRFFDAGLVYLGENMTFAYEDLMRTWERQAAADATAAIKNKSVTAKA